MTDFNVYLEQYIKAIDGVTQLDESTKDYTLDDYIKNVLALLKATSFAFISKDLPKLKNLTSDKKLLETLSSVEKSLDDIRTAVGNTPGVSSTDIKGSMVLNVDGTKTSIKMSNLYFVKEIEDVI